MGLARRPYGSHLIRHPPAFTLSKSDLLDTADPVVGAHPAGGEVGEQLEHMVREAADVEHVGRLGRLQAVETLTPILSPPPKRL